jgi:hypothetical protein
MKSFGFGLIGLIMIGVSAQASAQQTYDLTLQATGPSNPPTGTGSFTIDVLPPGTLGGLFLEGPPSGPGSPGSELTDMSFDFGGNIFDLSSENVPGSASAQFDSSGDLISIGYLGTDSSGDVLSINGLDYDLQGTSVSSIGTITAAAVPEPTSMTLMTVALVGMVAVRRRRQS